MKFLLLLTLVPLVSSQYCVSSWWPRTCVASSTGPCAPQSSSYASMEDCDADTDRSGTGWCTTSWEPKTCQLISSGNCIGTEYPSGGFMSEEACVGHAIDSSLTWCITNWWPKTCGQSGCAGGATFAFNSEAACMGEAAMTPAPGQWCVTSWWPRDCEQGTNCVPFSIFYDSEAECRDGNPDPNNDGWCHTSWNPPTCGRLSSGNCFGSEYPAGGYTSESECMGSDAMPTNLPQPGDWCLTRWWPALCEQVACNNEYHFSTEAACYEAAGQPVPDQTGSGWCVQSWWPLACVQISSGGCMVNAWRPTNGWESQEACENP